MATVASSSFFDTLNISAAALALYRRGRLASKEQRYEDAVQYYSDALDMESTPDIFKARVLEYRGEAYWLLSDFDAAAEDYRASMAIGDDDHQVARARVRLAEVTDFRGDYRKAMSLYRQALQEGTAINNLLVIGRARRGLGIVSRRQGNTEQALNYLTQALVVFRQLGEAREQARVLTSLGRTRHVRGEYQNALSAHFEAKRILELLNDRWRILQVLSDIGECHQSLYDMKTALEYHEQALEMAGKYGVGLLKPEIQRNLGVDLVELDRYEEGVAYLLRALKGAREVSNWEQEALSLYNLARAYVRREHVEAALRIVTELNELADHLDADRYRALAAFARGEALFSHGDRAAAEEELNMAMLAAQTALDRGVLWKLHAALGHVIEDEDIAKVHATIAAEFIRQTAEPLQDDQLKTTFLNAPPVLAVLQVAGVDSATL